MKVPGDGGVPGTASHTWSNCLIKMVKGTRRYKPPDMKVLTGV